MIEVIPKPDMRACTFTITGTAPYVQCPWPEGVRTMRTCTPLPERRLHYETEAGWLGIPANGIRHSLIDACRVVGFRVAGRLALFVEADGFDAIGGMPLVRFTKGKPRVIEHAVRIQGTVDIRKRACWDPGWEAEVRIQYDEDTLLLQDVENLLARAGLCVGIGEGRPSSRSSSGMAWGTFSVSV